MKQNNFIPHLRFALSRKITFSLIVPPIPGHPVYHIHKRHLYTVETPVFELMESYN